MKQGDTVTRKSYGHDVMFKIIAIEGQTAILRGMAFRLLADAPLHDLVAAKEDSSPLTTAAQSRSADTLRLLAEARQQQIDDNMKQIAAKLEGADTYFEVPGKVLHIDGDASYLQKSLDLYRQLRVPAEGFHTAESEMASLLKQVMPHARPDIVVITGHDGMLKGKEGDRFHLSSYKNSQHFVRAIQVARQYERNKDALTIVAGACQSHFEALLRAGANFASSPGRILIHALDPVHIAAKVAYTSIKDTVNMVDVISHTISGMKGIGGIESRGSYRIGLPNLQINH